MCTLTHFAVACEHPFVLNAQGPGPDTASVSLGRGPMFQVIPAGNAFFHIREKSTGLVRGFREDHSAACALARSLESRIELLTGGPLR